jgi:hypothetical protein
VSGDKKYWIETYGCQMNFAESNAIESSLLAAGLKKAESAEVADFAILNTCSVRKTAENRIWGRIGYFQHLKESKPMKGNPIVAFSDKLVSVDSKGNVYKDGTFDETNTKITLFDRKQDYFRYPSFERNDKLYIQDRSYDFWTIAADGTKAKAEAKFDDISKKNIRVMSYLADNNTIYLGTYANGIWTVKLD